MLFLAKFKNLAAMVFCVSVASTNLAQAQNTITIRNDGGGLVRDYVIKANLAQLRGDKVRISGWCASACTAYLGNTNTCVTPSATFGFHGPSGGTAAENRRAAETLARNLPAVLRTWYLREAAQLQGQSYIELSAEQLVSIGGAKWC